MVPGGSCMRPKAYRADRALYLESRDLASLVRCSSSTANLNFLKYNRIETRRSNSENRREVAATRPRYAPRKL